MNKNDKIILIFEAILAVLEICCFFIFFDWVYIILLIISVAVIAFTFYNVNNS